MRQSQSNTPGVTDCACVARLIRRAVRIVDIPFCSFCSSVPASSFNQSQTNKKGKKEGKERRTESLTWTSGHAYADLSPSVCFASVFGLILQSVLSRSPFSPFSFVRSSGRRGPLPLPPPTWLLSTVSHHLLLCRFNLFIFTLCFVSHFLSLTAVSSCLHHLL